MSHFAGMEELLQDFLLEAGELLAQVDNQLVELEKRPHDRNLLNDIFRGFHTIKGGAGFLNVDALVNLCHKTENLFDMLRNGQRQLSPELMDLILAATRAVRDMFDDMSQAVLPPPADATLLAGLEASLYGDAGQITAKQQPLTARPAQAGPPPAGHDEIDWALLHAALTGVALPIPEAQASTGATSAAALLEAVGISPTEPAPQSALGPEQAGTALARSSGIAAPSQQSLQKETTIRVDTARLDQVLNLSGEIGLTKNRIATLKSQILHGRSDSETLKNLDLAVSQLDLLVSDLQNAVMKTRMQPIGRLFQKYPRLARDLARQLGKDVELVLTGEDTELDKTMIEDLNDPLVHLVRNAVDHGIEPPEERRTANKPGKALISLSASQLGDHIYIEIADDGAGMRPDVIRAKAVEKGLIGVDAASGLDDRQSLQLIFLPGFSTKDNISNVSGRGVGMDVVKTNITRLNGKIDIESRPGQGTTLTIALPLTLAILPVLVIRLNAQSFAVPLSLVREIMPVRPEDVQRVQGRATMIVRDEVLPVRSLARMIGWQAMHPPAYGVLMQVAGNTFILAVDGFVGRDDVVIKPLADIKPKGIAGATLSGDGSIVLVLDMEELLASAGEDPPGSLFAKVA